MKADNDKSKQELIRELEDARKEIQRLEKLESIFPQHVEELLNSLPELVSLHDLDFKVIYSNWSGLGAIPEEERVLGEKCHKIFRGLDQPCPDCWVGEVIKTKKPLHTELEHSEDFIVELFIIPIMDEEGNPCFFLELVRDITEIKNHRRSMQAVQDQLVDHNKLLQGILDGIPDVVAVVRPDRTVTRYNQAGYDLLGISEEEFTPRKCYELLGRKKSCESCATAKAVETGKLACLEKYVSDFKKYLDCRSNPIFDENGEVTSIIQILMDITDRKEFESKLKQSEQRLRGIFESVDMVAVQGYDHNRKVIFWNKPSEMLYGYTQEEAMGQRLEDLIIPDPMRKAVIEGINDWLNDGPPIPPGELTLRHKNGSPVHVHSSHVMQKNFTGKKEMYCIDVNLAEVKKAHRELIKAKELAEAANYSKSEFLANMSHEIRTPMNGILGMFQLMATTDMDDEQKEYVQMGMQASKRLTGLLSDILDLSKVEAGKLSLGSQEFDLRKMLNQVFDLLQPMMSNSDVDIILRIDPGLPQTVVGDSLRMQQVLTNLLGNAFKFTHKGRVTLGAAPLASEDNKSRILFKVSDTGIGIPEDRLGEIFNHFIQLGEGYTRNYQGAGLGLSICKQLVSLMGGSIFVESAPGDGTDVYVSISFDLPAPKTSDEEVEDKTDVMSDLATRVLLVEDDYISSLTAQRQMEKVGCEVTLATNGKQALEALDKARFDLVLMDIQMPVMDGVEATKAIRNGQAGEDKKSVPIVAMTAYAMLGDKENFLEAGMNDYIAKPIEFDELMLILAKIRANEL